MDAGFSVCIVMRGAVGARLKDCHIRFYTL